MKTPPACIESVLKGKRSGVSPVRLGSCVGALILLMAAVSSSVLLRQSSVAAEVSSTANVPVAPAEKSADGTVPSWGELVITDIALDLPEEYAAFDLESTRETVWQFPGLNLDQVRAVLVSAGLDPRQVELAASGFHPSSVKDGTLLQVDESLVTSLTPRVRSRLYSQLGAFESNPHQRFPYSIRHSDAGKWLSSTDLAPETRALFQQLVYPRGNLECFSDLEVVLRRLDGDRAKTQFLKTVAREPAVLAGVRIRPDTDIERLIGYWGHGAKSLDLRPLLDSLKQKADGGTLSLLHLLPRFARDHLFTFPTPVIDGQKPLDCHWSTMNFFNETTDDSFLTNGVSTAYVQQHFYQVGAPNRLGDVVFLHDSSGKIRHSARFIAGDLVFTKNGNSFTRPWILMHLGDLRDQYGLDRPAQIAVFRARGE